jgi:hypothetical protein
MPKRAIEGHVITSDAQPAIRVQIDGALTYVGSLSMIIKRTAQAESFLFVAADDQQRITRYLNVQFEHFLDSVPDKSYNYHTDRVETIAGVAYDTDLRVVPAYLGREDEPEPDSDTAQITALLTGQGYTMPYHLDDVVIKRMVWILDEDRRAEFLLVYIEAMTDTPITTREEDQYLVPSADAHTLAAFEQRARDSFRVIG